MFLTQSCVRESQTKVSLGQVRIELDGLLESVSGFVVLITAIKRFALFDQNPGLGPIALGRAAHPDQSVCIGAGFISATTSLTKKQRKYDDYQCKLHYTLPVAVLDDP